MKALFFYSLLTISLFSCKPPAPQPGSSEKENSKIDSSVKPGSDRDAHGCIPSAGYTWSEVRKECLRLWESGNRFTAYGDNKDSTLAAYLIIGFDNVSAEIFLPGNKNPIPLKATDGNMDQKAVMQIYQNADSTSFIKFFPSQARYVLYVDKKPMFACPHPLK